MERESRLRKVPVNGQAGIGKTRLVWEAGEVTGVLGGVVVSYLERMASVRRGSA